MRIIAFASLKGGTAKSTLARHVAVDATRSGHRVVIVDCDQQATLRGWGQDRGAPPLVIAETSTTRRYVEAALDRLRKDDIDLVVFDTPGSFDGGYAANAVALSDFVIVPCRPSGEDTAAFWDTEERVQRAGKSMGAVISQAPTTTLKPASELRALFQEASIHVCPVTVHTRQIVAASFADGKTVFELPKDTASDRSAAVEMHAVWAWIAQQIGMTV